MNISPLEQQVIDAARQKDVLGETCRLVEYDPDIGRVPEHWRARLEVMAVVEIVVALTETERCQRSWLAQPDLIAACKGLITELNRYISNPEHSPVPAVVAARAAIAKAIGSAS